MFSARVPALRQNRVAQVLGARRDVGRGLVDLTVSNPTAVGLSYPPRLLDVLSDPGGLVYDPVPFGLSVGRDAVAGYLGSRGTTVRSDHVVLTASTSEAYSLLFKLLCDPGDRVLVPQPSYPLFEHLTRLESVVASPYSLEYHGRWRIDHNSLERAVESRTRAILLVNPNNPTGSYIAADDLATVRKLAAKRELAIISDEVFEAYALDPDRSAANAPPADASEVLTFKLGGLSKSALLPQLKLGWIRVDGPERLVRQALDRLEFICDSYLSVSVPVQLAAAAILEQTRPLVAQVCRRIRENHGALLDLACRQPSCQVLRVEGGWYAVLQVPATRSEETLVVELIEKDGVLVHPGYFFDFPHEAFLVVSLLPEPGQFASAMQRVLARATA